MAHGELWVSDELRSVLAKLSPQQAAGVLRIVQAELAGRTLSSLLDCPGQICGSSTFYGTHKRTGWRQKPDFNTALDLARRDYRKWMLERGVGDALVVLAESAPHAARALRSEVVGNDDAVTALEEALKDTDSEMRLAAAEQLGETGLARVVPALRIALIEEQDAGVRKVILAALGKVARGHDADRRTAAVGILDRADVKTAAKQAFTVSDKDVDAAIEQELARLAGGRQTEIPGPPAADAISAHASGAGGEAAPVGLDDGLQADAGTG